MKSTEQLKTDIYKMGREDLLVLEVELQRAQISANQILRSTHGQQHKRLRAEARRVCSLLRAVANRLKVLK